MPRLTDNDRHLGRFITYARCSESWRPLRVVYSSGATEDGPGPNTLAIYLFGWIFRLLLPRLLDDYRVRHIAASWDAATVARLGRNWYEKRHPREYGFSLSDGFLQVFLGAQTHDSTTTQSWCAHLPWTQWRHIRTSHFNPDGSHFWTEWTWKRELELRDEFTVRAILEKACPSCTFEFDDFDGRRISATCRIKEREWRIGVGWFKWLSLFRAPRIVRSLELEFSEEVGPEKGSWKGGTLGHGIEMLPGENPEDAFRRYCDQDHRSKCRSFRIKFVGAVRQPC